MWFNFGKSSSINPEKELEGLLKAQEMLNKRFEMKQMTNEVYLKKAEEIRKKIEKCNKLINQKEK